MDLKTKTVCFVDNGLFVAFAQKVAPAFKKVYYTTPWQSAFPKKRDLVVGEGFAEIERINRPLRLADEIDLWVFPDLYHADLQLFLESHGARVWGARDGEALELERWETREWLKSVGLPVAHAEHVVGLPALRAHLARQKERKFVKVNYRGDRETFAHERMETTEPVLNSLAHDLDVLGEDYEFLVEDEIPDAVETGFDGYTVDGKWPGWAMEAIEIKDLGMIGVPKRYGQLSEAVRRVNEKLSGPLREHRYRGWLSTEIRWTRDRKPYLIDPCCRLGTPSNELLQELFTGWPEVLWEGAGGNVVDLRPAAKYGVLAMVHSGWARREWQAVQMPAAMERWTKLRNAYRRPDGVTRVVPHRAELSDVGAVVGTGNTLLEAIRQVKAHADELVGYDLEVNLESVDKALDVIAKGERYGIRFTDEPLPTAEQLRQAVWTP